jgi:hypothetical protein
MLIGYNDALVAANDGLTIAHDVLSYKDGYVVGGAYGFNEVSVPNTLEGRSTATAEVIDRLNRGHDVGIWVETCTGLGQARSKLVIDSVSQHDNRDSAITHARQRGERAIYDIAANDVFPTPRAV